MTRKEAFKEYDNIGYTDCFFNSGKIDEDTELLINKIYDEFEFRICKNCKWYEFIMPQNNPHDQYNYSGCIKLQSLGQIDSDFGCNKFERRN